MLFLAALCTQADAANLWWDFAPGTANGVSNGGGTTSSPGSWQAANAWDKGTGNGYQSWVDGNDAFIVGTSALQLTASVTANTLNITSGKVILQSDAAANNHILTLTNGGTIGSSASVTFGSEQANTNGNERSLDVRLGGDINTSGTFGGNLDIFGGSILSSSSTAARSIFANVRIGYSQGNTNGTVATLGDSTRTGSLLIAGNLSTFGGSRRIDIAAGTTVEVAGNLVNQNGGPAAGNLQVAGEGTLKTAGVFSNFSDNTFTVGSGTQSTVVELTGGGVMSNTGGAVGTWENNTTINSSNATLRFNSTFASSATPGVQTLSGVISGSGKVVQQGAGTLALSNTNTYSGTTTVSGGALALTSTGATGTGAVTVKTGGSILGTGSVRGSSFTAESGSTVHAGNGTAQGDYGTLNFTPVSGSGSFDFQSGSSVVLGINPGGTGDLLNFNGLSAGSLTFNGNLQVTASGYTPTSAQTLNLLDWTNLSTVTFASRYSAGSYSGFLLGNGDDNQGFDLPDIAGSGYAWDISQFTLDGTIRTVVLVPEPSRVLLALAGLLVVVMRRRRF